MKNYQQLQQAVGEWSLTNFGRQPSRCLTVPLPELTEKEAKRGKKQHAHGIAVNLESLAPLMGVVEEVGELFESSKEADIKDAVGDIFIYLCDFSFRENCKLPIGVDSLGDDIDEKHGPEKSLIVYVGKLHHCMLKRHQGIRGYDDDDKFKGERIRLLYQLLGQLERFVKETLPKTNLLQIANETWNEIVSKRDWKKDPKTGQKNK